MFKATGNMAGSDGKIQNIKLRQTADNDGASAQSLAKCQVMQRHGFDSRWKNHLQSGFSSENQGVEPQRNAVERKKLSEKIAQHKSMLSIIQGS